MPKLSVCILALNEEKNIARVLDSVKSLADELVVCIDEHSTDKTETISTKYTKNVYRVPHEKALEWQLQRMFAYCHNEWILRLDADEELSQSLQTEIKLALEKPQFPAYAFPRKNFILGKWIEHAIWYPDYQTRLFQRDTIDSSAEIKIHAPLKIKGELGYLTQPLIHYNYENLSQYLEKLVRYTNIEAEALFEKKYKLCQYELLTKPFANFIKLFLALEGYKDGVHGLVLALLQSFYEFLVLAKLWELYKYKPDGSINLATLNSQFNLKFKEWKWWLDEINIRLTNSTLNKFVLKLKRKILSL